MFVLFFKQKTAYEMRISHWSSDVCSSDLTIPYIYLTVDVRLDALLKLRSDLNAALGARGIKLSVNDLLIKALGVTLKASPKCNVTYAGDKLIAYNRADV